jgi:hypothetical protein
MYALGVVGCGQFFGAVMKMFLMAMFLISSVSHAATTCEGQAQAIQNTVSQFSEYGNSGGPVNSIIYYSSDKDQAFILSEILGAANLVIKNQNSALCNSPTGSALVSFTTSSLCEAMVSTLQYEKVQFQSAEFQNRYYENLKALASFSTGEFGCAQDLGAASLGKSRIKQ